MCFFGEKNKLRCRKFSCEQPDIKVVNEHEFEEKAPNLFDRLINCWAYTKLAAYNEIISNYI